MKRAFCVRCLEGGDQAFSLLIIDGEPLCGMHARGDANAIREESSLNQAVPEDPLQIPIPAGACPPERPYQPCKRGCGGAKHSGPCGWTSEQASAAMQQQPVTEGTAIDLSPIPPAEPLRADVATTLAVYQQALVKGVIGVGEALIAEDMPAQPTAPTLPKAVAKTVEEAKVILDHAEQEVQSLTMMLNSAGCDPVLHAAVEKLETALEQGRRKEVAKVLSIRRVSRMELPRPVKPLTRPRGKTGAIWRELEAAVGTEKDVVEVKLPTTILVGCFDRRLKSNAQRMGVRYSSLRLADRLFCWLEKEAA